MISCVKVDLGYVQKVSAVGTMYKLRKRHARRLMVHSSTNGIHWHNDGQVIPYATQILGVTSNRIDRVRLEWDPLHIWAIPPCWRNPLTQE